MICIYEADWKEIDDLEFDRLRSMRGECNPVIAGYTRVDGDQFGPGRMVETVWAIPDGRWIQCSDADAQNGGHRHWVGIPREQEACDG